MCVCVCVCVCVCYICVCVCVCVCYLCRSLTRWHSGNSTIRSGQNANTEPDVSGCGRLCTSKTTAGDTCTRPACAAWRFTPVTAGQHHSTDTHHSRPRQAVTLARRLTDIRCDFSRFCELLNRVTSLLQLSYFF